jgi:hypothetical protein
MWAFLGPHADDRIGHCEGNDRADVSHVDQTSTDTALTATQTATPWQPAPRANPGALGGLNL